MYVRCYVAYVSVCLYVCLSVYLQCESKKSPLRLSDFFQFSQTVKDLNRFFTHLSYVPMYARLQIFIQLSPKFDEVMRY